MLCNLYVIYLFQDQYIFAHLSILEYLTFGDTEISVIDFEKKFKGLQKADGIENEFSVSNFKNNRILFKF